MALAHLEIGEEGGQQRQPGTGDGEVFRRPVVVGDNVGGGQDLGAVASVAQPPGHHALGIAVDDPLVARQIGDGLRRALLGKVARAGVEPVAQRRQHLGTGAGGVVEREHGVEDLLAAEVKEYRGREEHEVELDLRMRGAEGLQHLRVERGAELARGADPQHACRVVLHRGHRGGGVVAQRQDVLAAFEQHPPRIGEFERAAAAGEKLGADLLLELLQLQADRGLRQAVQPCRNRDRAGFGDLDEGAQRLKIHQQSSIFLDSYPRIQVFCPNF
nr:hypothetical protein [Alloyangia mangrovi]